MNLKKQWLSHLTDLQSIKKKHWLIGILFLLIFTLIIIQQMQISDLQSRLDYITMDEKESYASRLTNLEYIINAHTATLHEHERDVFYFKEAINDLHWRILKEEWQTKE